MSCLHRLSRPVRVQVSGVRKTTLAACSHSLSFCGGPPEANGCKKKHAKKEHATRVPPHRRAAANDRGYNINYDQGSQQSAPKSYLKLQTSTKPVLCPGIGGVTVAADFPETGLIFGNELNRANKLGPFPCIKLRDNHARGATVIARDRFAVELRSHERIVIEGVLESDIGGIAIVAAEENMAHFRFRFRQSNLLQVVTQWKSETSSNCGRALNSSQVNVFGFSTNPPISRRQSFNAISGLMPRSRIGKPWVRCWPGGRRSLERGPSRTGGFPGWTSGFARRTGDFALPDIFLAQRSLRSIRLGLGIATIGILTADHADCADFLQLDKKTTRLRDNKTGQRSATTSFA